jgi:hypothetical protein
MHGKNHSGRRARPRQHVTDIANIRDACPFSAELDWDQYAKEALRFGGGESLGWKARLIVDLICGQSRNRRNFRGALPKFG